MPHNLTQLLLDHRARGALIEKLETAMVPQTTEEAYRIQDETVSVLGPVGAWKIQPMPATGVPLAAPILASTIFKDCAELRLADFPGTGIEVEIAVTLKTDLPQRDRDYAASELLSAIASIHLAFEILSSRFIDAASVPHLAGVADLQHSGAIVVGAAVGPEPLREFRIQPIALDFDGQIVATTPGNANTANMLEALAWLANHAVARGLPLKANDIVITGSRIGPLPVTCQKATAIAHGFGGVSATFV